MPSARHVFITSSSFLLQQRDRTSERWGNKGWMEAHGFSGLHFQPTDGTWVHTTGHTSGALTLQTQNPRSVPLASWVPTAGWGHSLLGGPRVGRCGLWTSRGPRSHRAHSIVPSVSARLICSTVCIAHHVVEKILFKTIQQPRTTSLAVQG